MARGADLLAETTGEPGRAGAESLLPCVDRALAEAGVKLEALDGFAVSIGPGSFTGLRVGLATVKGLAFGGDQPVAAVPTLTALARGAAAPGAVVIASLDARRGEVYAAGVRFDAALEPAPCSPAEGVYTPEQLAAALDAPALLVGDGVGLCGERLRELAPVAIDLGPAHGPHARDVAALGAAMLARGEAAPAARLVPRYVRRAEAEVKRTGERFE